MIVFRNYFKILKDYLPTAFIYIAIFCSISLIATGTGSNTQTFSKTKPNIAVINRDDDTPFLNSLEDYLKKNAKLVALKDEKESLMDALYYREVEYIIIVPKNFTADFLAGKNPRLETKKIPASATGTYLDSQLNQYLKTAEIYVQKGITGTKLNNYLKEDFSSQVAVTLTQGKNIGAIEKAVFYYNFSNYTFLAVFIMLIAMIMSTFHRTILKKRNVISGTPLRHINFQIFLGNICCAIFIWAIYVILGVIVIPGVVVTGNGLLFMLNSFLFCFVSVTIGFVIAQFVSNQDAINGLTNVIALGTSFLCGAFVPQSLLSSSVLAIGKLFPSYWFITNNNLIGEMTKFNWQTIAPLLGNMMIMVAEVLLLLVISKIFYKRCENK